MEPVGVAGWSSETLVFGEQITQLFGPNGCGKTPILQSIAYALGYPVKFRDDIYQHCSASVLTLLTEVGKISLRRLISIEFDVTVLFEGKETEHFYFERDYSKYLLDLFGFELPVLTSNKGDPVPPYMATLLPIFYLDQDQGYTSAYHAPSTFIKDQYVEMMRLTFGLPPKHSFERKKIVIEKRKRLDQLDHAIVVKRTVIENLSKEHGLMRRPLYLVDADIEEIRQKLNRLKESRSVKSDAHSAIDGLIDEHATRRRSLLSEISDLQARVDGLGRIKDEIEIEVNTLSLNEEARRHFSTFRDICANAACGLFLGSSDSYGKNLLYLRDQVKDLHRNSANQTLRIDALLLEVAKSIDEAAILEKKRDEIADGDEFVSLVDAIGELTRVVFDLQTERESLRKLEKDENTYVQLLNERDQLQNEIASMGGTANETDLEAIEIRSNWRNRILHWLDALRTMNVSRDLSIDADFEITFGTEKISQFKGSTLTRVVLAIHTATLEVYMADPARQLRFLILDTPRQQDIDREDLAHYIAELKVLASSQGAQIIFSTTNYRYQCAELDQEWAPAFPGEKQKMFLGTVSADQKELSEI